MITKFRNGTISGFKRPSTPWKMFVGAFLSTNQPTGAAVAPIASGLFNSFFPEHPAPNGNAGSGAPPPAGPAREKPRAGEVAELEKRIEDLKDSIARWKQIAKEAETWGEWEAAGRVISRLEEDLRIAQYRLHSLKS
jgi:hypothetical protein